MSLSIGPTTCPDRYLPDPAVVNLADSVDLGRAWAALVKAEAAVELVDEVAAADVRAVRRGFGRALAELGTERMAE